MTLNTKNTRNEQDTSTNLRGPSGIGFPDNEKEPHSLGETDQSQNPLENLARVKPMPKPKTLKEIQARLTISLVEQFKTLKKDLTCNKCNMKGQITNHGQGGGNLQHGTKSIQLLCRGCGQKARPDAIYAKSGFANQKDIYDETLKKYQIMAAELTKSENSGPVQKTIMSFFKQNAILEHTDHNEENHSKEEITSDIDVRQIIKNLQQTISDLTTELKDLRATMVEKDNSIATLTQMLTNKNANKPTDSRLNNVDNKQQQKLKQEQQSYQNPNKQTGGEEWQKVTYASKASKKPTKQTIKKIVKNINKERPEHPAEFCVLHIEFNNSKQISRLVKAKHYEALNMVMKKSIEAYEIKKEVIRFSRIGSDILEIYIAKANREIVEEKVYRNGGHFNEDFRAGIIPTEARERMSDETAQYIEKCIVNRATRQYFKAPTLKFKEAVIQNYRGNLEGRIAKSILERKEAMTPAPKGIQWAIQGYRIVQQKIIIPSPETQQHHDEDEDEDVIMTNIQNKRTKIDTEAQWAGIAPTQC
jgi:hypothetical protein